METPYSTVMPVIPRPEAVFVRGEVRWLDERRGRRYLGFVQGWAVKCQGYSQQLVVDALKHQAEPLRNPGTGSYSEPMLRRAKNLVEYSALNEVQQGGPDDE